MVKVDELLRQEVARLLLEEIEFPKEIIATVTRVKTTPDLKHANIFLSVFPFAQSTKAVKLAQAAARQIEKILNEELSMHSVPKLHFHVDATEQQAAEIDSVLDQLDIK